MTPEALAALLAAALADIPPWGWTAAGVVALLVLLLWRLAGAARRAAAPLQTQIAALAAGQARLDGALAQAAEAHAAAQARATELMERRLEEVDRRVGDSLHGAAARTARSLGALTERLAAVDRAQANIERLSGDMLGLQAILADKQARGAFGEVQLRDLLSDALPPTALRFQATLSNGRRADCVIALPTPPGPVAVDAKFPLEAYHALRAAQDEPARAAARRALRAALRKHVADVAERYVLPGETAEGALMFLPSEAVYAELHAGLPEVAQEALRKRVWIVGPSTLMATLTGLRAALQDARLARGGARVRAALAGLRADVAALARSAAKLDDGARRSLAELSTLRQAAEAAEARAAALEALEFEDHPQASGLDAPASDAAVRMGSQ